MTDPIADMLTRLRNAAAIHKPEVVLPSSKLKWQIIMILKKEGYITDCKKIEKGTDDKFEQIKVMLSYVDGRSKFQAIKRISKPGLRIYVKKDAVPRVLNGFGIAILSTPTGLMTNKEAKKKGCGGEVICEIY